MQFAQARVLQDMQSLTILCRCTVAEQIPQTTVPVSLIPEDQECVQVSAISTIETSAGASVLPSFLSGENGWARRFSIPLPQDRVVDGLVASLLGSCGDGEGGTPATSGG